MRDRRNLLTFLAFLLLLNSAAFWASASPASEADSVKDLLASDPLVRKNTIDYFAVRPKLARPLAPNLVLMLEDPVSWVRDSAAICLGRLREESAYAPILRAVRRNRLSYNAGAYALGRFGDRAVPDMIKALDSKKKGVRFTALRYLARSKDPRAVDPLIAKFRSDKTSRLLLTLSFVEMGPIIQPPLIKLLSDPDPVLARAAADALKRIDDPIAEDALKFYGEIIANKQ